MTGQAMRAGRALMGLVVLCALSTGALPAGTDGAEYNMSIVMVYVGLAKAAYYGDNAKYLDWARAAEQWARTAGWNMWAPGGPYNGATRCNDPLQNN